MAASVAVAVIGDRQHRPRLLGVCGAREDRVHDAPNAGVRVFDGLAIFGSCACGVADIVDLTYVDKGDVDVAG